MNPLVSSAAWAQKRAHPTVLGLTCGGIGDACNIRERQVVRVKKLGGNFIGKKTTAGGKPYMVVIFCNQVQYFKTVYRIAKVENQGGQVSYY